MAAPLIPSVPPGTRLVQIGPFKTGTTAIQHAAASRREDLARLGVVYPGTGLNHRWGCSALVGLTWGWTRADAGSAQPWHGWELQREVRSAPAQARVWISYERLAVLDATQAHRLCDRIGGPVHILIGLRPLRSLLPSEWQQLVKSGRQPGDLDAWARHTLGEVAAGRPRARHLDHGGLVERWAQLVGADSVTCIVLEAADRELLPRSIEALLGLPTGFLVPPDHDGERSNRSLTASEVALVGAVARSLRDSGLSQREYHSLITRGVTRRILARAPRPDEPRVQLGADVSAAAAEADRTAAGRVRRAAVRVVGDLAEFTAAPKASGNLVGTTLGVGGTIPLAAAVEAVLGAAERTLPNGVRSTSSADLVRELLRRQRDRLRRLREGALSSQH